MFDALPLAAPFIGPQQTLSLSAPWGTVAVAIVVVLVVVAVLFRPRPATSNDRALLDALPLMVYSVEPRPPYQPLYLSPGIESLGYPHKEFMERPELWMSMIHPDDRDEVSRLTQQAMLRAEPFEYEYRVIDREGKVRWLHDRGSFQRDAKGIPVAWQGVMLEVTARREAERALRESEERFSDQLRQAQKMEAIGRLAGGIAHDFNNLLNVIGSYAALITAVMPDENPSRADLDEIQKAVDRGAALTRQLLTFSRFRMPEVKSIDIDATIRDAEQMVKRLLGPEIELDVRLDSRGARVTMDPGQLDQVLVNLIVNSADAMVIGREAKIQISTERVHVHATAKEPSAEHTGKALTPAPPIPEGDWVRIEVRDNGAGMNADTAARAIDPFFTTKEVGRGTGLGLSATYGIVVQAGGSFTIDSKVDVGTAVTISLPCREATAAEATGAVTLATAVSPATTTTATTTTVATMGTTPTATTSTFKGARVLVVDDEDGVRKTLTRILERNGFVVVSASSGEAALRAWDEHGGAFELAISDIRMPGMNGTELLRALRQRAPELPAIAMSGYPEDNLELPNSDRAPVRFIDKPFGMEAVLACVRKSLEKTAPSE